MSNNTLTETNEHTEMSFHKDTIWTKAIYKLRRDKIGLCSLSVVLIYLLLSCGVWFGLLGTQWDDTEGDMWEPCSAQHWLGTNINGQDLLDRALYGTKVAFEVGLIVAVLSTLLGALLGGLAGYFSGTIVDRLIMWLYGTLDSIPFYLLVAAVAFALKEFSYSMHVAMISTFWTSTCTVIRGEFIKIKNLEYVDAARAVGVPRISIIFKHIMPNTSHILLVQITIMFVAAIKNEVILSFLGLGIKEGVSWGLMFSAAAQDVPGGFLNGFLTATGFMFFLVLAFNIFSDALQDALDPKKVA